MMLAQSVKQITSEEVHQSILEGKHITLLDVRTSEEYKKGHIINSIHIPVDELEVKIANTVPDKSKTLYVYCLSGSRSNVAVNTLHQLGYHNAFSMTNGLLKWRVQKYELVM